MKTTAEIDAEKQTKPRPDLIPATAIHAAGVALGAGAHKHGGGKTGRGTFRDAGTEQATVATHYASLCRHLNAWALGEKQDECGALHLGCAMAQIAIMIDLEADPPGTPELDQVPRTSTLAEVMAGTDRAAERKRQILDPWALPGGWEWERRGPEWMARSTSKSRHDVYADLYLPEFSGTADLVARRNREDPPK